MTDNNQKGRPMTDKETGMRAAECARCIQAMAKESPHLFADKEKLSEWFFHVLNYEQAGLAQPSDMTLPVIPNDWVLRTLSNQFDPNGGDWYICVLYQISPLVGFTGRNVDGEGDTPRQAALAAIAKIKED